MDPAIKVMAVLLVVLALLVSGYFLFMIKNPYLRQRGIFIWGVSAIIVIVEVIYLFYH